MIKKIWIDHENGQCFYDIRDNIHDILIEYKTEIFFVSVKFNNGRHEDVFFPYRKINSVTIEK